MASQSWGPGYILEGKYRLSSKLGEGGMGSVWRAEHLTLNAPVAVKLLDPSIAETEEGQIRFIREAQAAAALRGTHVVQTFDYGVSEGVPYIVMELMVGDSLADRIASRGRLPPRVVSELLKQVARAISKAHQLGIVHRDLKPDNIFLCHGDEDEFTAKVLDFGIAKSTNPLAGSASDSKTRTGALMGTPYYMSPEQIQGTKNVDFRADLWALGVIVFECLTGFRPFDDEALGALLLKICSGPIPVPSQYGSVPDGFDAWFGRAVHRNPSERFGSVTEMAKAFEALLGGTPRADEAERRAEPERVSVTARTALGNSVGSDSLVGIFGTIRRSGGRRVTIAAIVATLVLTSAVGFVFLRGKSGAPPIAAVSGSAPVAEPAVQPSSAEGESKPEATPAIGASAASPPTPSPSGETESLEAPARKRPSVAQAARSAKEPKPATENPPVATVPPPTRKVDPSDPLTKRH